MKFRTVIAITAFISLATGVAIAQADAIAARKALMKSTNDSARALVQMIRGQVPFDASKVEAAYAQWTETAQKLPGLFPDDSKTGEETRASPKIWENKSAFDAKAAAFGKAVTDSRASATASLDGLKAAISTVGKACDDCHTDYRLSRQ